MKRMWTMNWAPQPEITGRRSTETAGSSGLSPSKQICVQVAVRDRELKLLLAIRSSCS